MDTYKHIRTHTRTRASLSCQWHDQARVLTRIERERERREREREREREKIDRERERE